MDFIKIARDGIDGVAEVPVSALPHWTSYGWYRVDQGATSNEPPTVEQMDAPQPPKPTPVRTSRRLTNPETTEE